MDLEKLRNTRIAAVKALREHGISDSRDQALAEANRLMASMPAGTAELIERNSAQ